jgi:hypothetical protein
VLLCLFYAFCKVFGNNYATIFGVTEDSMEHIFCESDLCKYHGKIPIGKYEDLLRSFCLGHTFLVSSGWDFLCKTFLFKTKHLCKDTVFDKIRV